MAAMEGSMLIGGELVEAAGGDWIESVNPATEEIIGRAPAGKDVDIGRAVDAALEASPSWAALSVDERAAHLNAVADGIAERESELIGLEVADTGNTVAKVGADVRKAADRLRYYAGLGHLVTGETTPATPSGLHLTVRQPYGVVGRIIPFNHPLGFLARAIAGPLITGNAVVVKPPEQSPLSACVLAEICRAILPVGVVNIVTGRGPEAGAALASHRRVKRIAFTGSVETGMAVQRAAAEAAVKHVTLELGGKNPMIVFPDADIERATAGAVAGMNLAWQGQSCGAISRLLVHETIHDRVLVGVTERVAALRIGDPMDPASDIGPVNSKAQYEKVMDYVARGRSEGARLETGGSRPQGPGFDKGYWIEPAVFSGVTRDMTIAREEIFGPVLSVMRWSETDEAVDIANATRYGLTAAVWTRDIDTAIDMARRIDAGYVWINGASRHYPNTPFGGMKDSGVGREEGLDELLSYTETKTIHILSTASTGRGKNA